MTFNIQRKESIISVWLYDIKWDIPIKSMQFENGSWDVLKWPIGIPNSLKPTILNQLNQEEHTC